MAGWGSGPHSVHRDLCHLLQLLLPGPVSCSFLLREGELRVHHLCDAFVFAFRAISIWHHRFCGCRPLKTVWLEQIISDKLKAPWSHFHEGGKKNQTKNWRLIFFMVDASSMLFREQKESIGLRREGKIWGMCMIPFFFFYFTALSHVATHLVFRTIADFHISLFLK